MFWDAKELQELGLLSWERISPEATSVNTRIILSSSPPIRTLASGIAFLLTEDVLDDYPLFDGDQL
jgi:hypothetical protein